MPVAGVGARSGWSPGVEMDRRRGVSGERRIRINGHRRWRRTGRGNNTVTGQSTSLRGVRHTRQVAANRGA